MTSISIVIRTLNEKDNLIRLLSILETQNFTGEKEIIVVDNESTDGTVDVAKKAGAKIVTIKRDDFSYPKSMNLGVENAKYPLVILLVGHAFPTSKNWISRAENHFRDPKVMGVYSPVLPNKPFGISEFFLYYPRFFLDKIRSPFLIKKVKRGVFAATNLMLRKELWDKHHFEEMYELGGEDVQWANWVIKQGYKIICDTNFVVRHSHHLSFLGTLKQFKYWEKLSRPSEFDRKDLSFRKDIDFR